MVHEDQFHCIHWSILSNETNSKQWNDKKNNFKPKTKYKMWQIRSKIWINKNVLCFVNCVFISWDMTNYNKNVPLNTFIPFVLNHRQDEINEQIFWWKTKASTSQRQRQRQLFLLLDFQRQQFEKVDGWQLKMLFIVVIYTSL